MSRKAFTLIELLIVVLIIGILSAIAIPMYQGAVDKSHWSTMLPGAKAIKDAEEAIKMTNGAYTDNMANLDVTMNNTDLTFALVTPNNTADPNVIRVTNSKLANVRLASYLDQSPMFAGQLHCEAKTGDERAERLCGKLLMGQDLTSADGYTAYLLDQEIDKATCDHVSRTWSKKNTKCFKTEEDRCKANGMPYTNGVCGYTNTKNVTIEEDGICRANQGGGCNNAVINEGGVCQVSGTGSAGGCQYSTINAGGECKGSWNDRACFYSTVNEGGVCNGSCEYSQINKGGVCKNGCSNVIVNEGGICESNCWNCCGGAYTVYKSGSKCIATTPSNGCGFGTTYEGTACCEGLYCPNNVPKC
ncbi:MAG: pilin [Elusimicrobiaceae bacterium]|nr:pilin [Elusimicrobiaceae bacterium]